MSENRIVLSTRSKDVRTRLGLRSAIEKGGSVHECPPFNAKSFRCKGLLSLDGNPIVVHNRDSRSLTPTPMTPTPTPTLQDPRDRDPRDRDRTERSASVLAG